MAEEKDQGKAAAAEKPSVPTAEQQVGALGQFVNVAAALEAARQQVVFEATKLPEKRLDDASESGGSSGHYLRDDGVKVDANGNEIK